LYSGSLFSILYILKNKETMASIKLSNIHLYKDELLKRLRGFNSPGKKNLVLGLKNEDYLSVIKELVYRFELYVSSKILNYPKGDANLIVEKIHEYGYNTIAQTAYKKISNMNATFNLNEAENKYSEFFKDKLEAYGVKSPSQLTTDKKKQFFNEIQKEWSKEKINESILESLFEEESCNEEDEDVYGFGDDDEDYDPYQDEDLDNLNEY
jgi:hypothetical protein